MRLILISLLLMSVLNAKNFGIVIIDNNTLNYNDSLKPKIEALFKEQSINYSGENSLEVFIDRDKKVKKIYTQLGTAKIIEYAQSKKYDSIALVEYKKGSKFLSVMVFPTDEKIQDKKSKSVGFRPEINRELAKTVLSTVLMLNYELGVLHVKTTY